MTEVFILLTLFLLLMMFSMFYRTIIIRAKRFWFSISIPAYFCLTWLYCEEILNIRQFLRDETKMKLDFGHAEIMLAGLSVCCFATGLILVISMIAHRAGEL